MQVWFLPPGWTAALCFALWFVLQSAPAFFCFRLPVRAFDPARFPYRMFSWEKDGTAYDRLVRVSVWKRFLPDGAAVAKGGYRKKSMRDFSRENLERFVAESCRAELTHWLAILPFWVFGLFAPPVVLPIMFVYALAVNLPCIIAQRYNRPRVVRVLRKMATQAQ